MLEDSLPPASIVISVRSRLRREVCLPPGTMAISRLGCCRDHVQVSGPTAARGCADIGGSCCHWSHTDSRGLDHLLGPSSGRRVVLPLGPY